MFFFFEKRNGFPRKSKKAHWRLELGLTKKLDISPTLHRKNNSEYFLILQCRKKSVVPRKLAKCPKLKNLKGGTFFSVN